MLSPLRLLHLENSPLDAAVIHHKLQEAGLSCDILLVDSQSSFEAALTQRPFDLILSDYDLAGYDCISALAYAQHAQPDVPVIVISGTVDDGEAVRCLQLGATDYLLKDRLERLASAVDRTVRQAETRRSRRLTEAKLQASEQLNRSLVAHLPQRMFVKDLSSRYVFCNALYARDLGIEPAEIVGKDDFAFLSRERADGQQADDRLVMTDGTITARDERYTVDGREQWIHSVKIPYRDEQGTIIGVLGVLEDISERKRAEQALRNERDRAQHYLDAAEVILLKLDLDGRILLINRYGCALLGWNLDELLGRDWIETCLPARTRAHLEGKRRELLGGDLSIVENPVTTRSGEERLVEWRHRLLRDDDGCVIGSFSSGTDITERNKAIEALRAAEERTRFALHAADVGIWDLDYATGVLRWSEAIEVHYGLQPGTFGGTFEAFIELIHPDDRAAVLETVTKAMKARADFSVLSRAIRPDGSIRWLSGAGRVIFGEHGEPVRAVGISQDVTERRQADETRARLAAIVESSNDAIVSIAPDGTILTWNTGAERLYRYTADEAIGRSRALILPVDKVAELTEIMAKAARGEPGESFETQRIRKDGSRVDVSLTISPMTDSTGRVTGASTIARDITSRLKAEAELTRLNHEIQLQRLRVFKATIRTVQDIVNNLLGGFQLVRFEGEGHLPVELLNLVDDMVAEAGVKLKTLGDLETVNEKEMAIGMGIDYPGAGH